MELPEALTCAPRVPATWPGDSANESKSVKARAFPQSHSASGMPEKAEGNRDVASGGMAAVN
jgi:hypothetical protein